MKHYCLRNLLQEGGCGWNEGSRPSTPPTVLSSTVCVLDFPKTKALRGAVLWPRTSASVSGIPGRFSVLPWLARLRNLVRPNPRPPTGCAQGGEPRSGLRPQETLDGGRCTSVSGTPPPCPQPPQSTCEGVALPGASEQLPAAPAEPSPYLSLSGLCVLWLLTVLLPHFTFCSSLSPEQSAAATSAAGSALCS